MVMLEYGETTCEGWKEGEGGGKGVLEVLDLEWCEFYVAKKKAFLDGFSREELEIPGS